MPRRNHLPLLICTAACAILAPTVAHCDGMPAAQEGHSSQLEMGTLCGPTTATSHLHETWRSWDPRFSEGRVDKACLDEKTRISIVPVKASAQFDKFSERTVVVIEMTAADGKAVEKLFSDALAAAANGKVFRDLVLIDGKIVVGAFIASPFSGTTLEFNVGSDDDARRVAALLSDVSGN